MQTRVTMKPVLDVCCGGRMFWFNKQNPHAVFVDRRRETLHADSREGRRHIVIDPDMLADFRNLPFANDEFSLVVFDPPHLKYAGGKGWLAKKYGKLERDWKDQLRRGFTECFRVLKPNGTLIFKWNEHEIPVKHVLALSPREPLFGNRCGKTSKSHWVVFVKTYEP